MNKPYPSTPNKEEDFLQLAALLCRSLDQTESPAQLCLTLHRTLFQELHHTHNEFYLAYPDRSVLLPPSTGFRDSSDAGSAKVPHYLELDEPYILQVLEAGQPVIFNDPIPCDEPIRCAVELAFEAHDSIARLLQKWTRLGHQLGFGIGIAAGYATMGIVGDDSRSDYTAIGNDINLASRLCDHANNGETLISQKAYLEIEAMVEGREVTGLELKGVNRTMVAFSISRST